MKLLRAMMTVAGILSLAITGQLQAQQSSRSDLQGLSGKLSISPNVRLGQTTIAFTSSVPLNSTSSQIIFVVQMPEDGSFPNSWSGQARVLTGDGVLVVSPLVENGAPSNIGLLFKFAEKAIPPSVKNWTLTDYATYGIARYGEITPLSESQIEALATTGKFVSEKPSGNFVLGSRALLPNETNPNPPVLPGCTSGGPGATGCGAGSGGCTVTCGSGYYACCNANNNNCGCVKVLRSSSHESKSIKTASLSRTVAGLMKRLPGRTMLYCK